MERNELVWFLIPVVMLLISAVMWWLGEAQEKGEALAMSAEPEDAPAGKRRLVLKHHDFGSFPIRENPFGYRFCEMRLLLPYW
jgi:hypothetical protein